MSRTSTGRTQRRVGNVYERMYDAEQQLKKKLSLTTLLANKKFDAKPKKVLEKLPAPVPKKRVRKRINEKWLKQLKAQVVEREKTGAKKNDF